jgi:pimeloyl-ACP methyl ester carboxylesterase
MVNGVNLYYEEHGTGYPLVFIHGFAGTTHAWHPQVPALTRTCRLITMDLRGHGQSDAPADPALYSDDILTEDVHQLLRHLGVTEAVVGGLSMGVYMSLKYYAAHPEMVKALILINGGPGFRNPARRQEWNDRNEEVARLIEAGGMKAFLGHPFAKTEIVYTPPKLMVRHNPVGIVNILRRVMHMEGSAVIDRLSQVKVPTIVIQSDKDLQIKPATDYIHRSIPGCEHALITDADHACNIEQPEQFNRIVLEFLARHGF